MNANLHMMAAAMAALSGGFMPPNLPATGIEAAPGGALFARGVGALELPAEMREPFEAFQRGEQVDPGVLSQILYQRDQMMMRAISTSTTAFPVRENLEQEAALLLPEETPVRNMTPRIPGAGVAVAWKQVTSLGGGWGSSYDQGGGGSAAQVFFAETGAPAELTTVYANKSTSYKLMGALGGVTGFAMASGANFQNQLAQEKTNSIRNLMLLEEFALINGDATATAAPWGDGSNALSFNGLINLITTANGVPAAQVQTSVGALTFAHIDAQLVRVWKQGGYGRYILCNAQETQSIKNLALASGTIHRVIWADQGNGRAGASVQSYTCPVTGEIIPVITSRFVPAGTMIFGSKQAPTVSGGIGDPFVVNVLPQVQLPELAPNQNIQGYTAQELAPTHAAPQVHKFLTSVYETTQMRNALVFAKSTGVTAVA